MGVQRQHKDQYSAHRDNDVFVVVSLEELWVTSPRGTCRGQRTQSVTAAEMSTVKLMRPRNPNLRKWSKTTEWRRSKVTIKSP